MSQLHVICRIAGAEYAIPAGDVQQMEAYSGATPVPGAPPYVAGLVQLRQQVVPVIDARARFGLETKAPTEESRLVVLRLGSRLVSLLVDSAREVQLLAPEQFQTPPDILANGFVKAVAQVKDRIILLIDAWKVAGEETVNG